MGTFFKSVIVQRSISSKTEVYCVHIFLHFHAGFPNWGNFYPSLISCNEL